MGVEVESHSSARPWPVKAGVVRARVVPTLALALASLALALWLAVHHPLWPGVALAAVLAVAAISARWRHLWLVAVPACLPWLDFAPWSGWLMASEFDLLLLAVFAGSYARLGWKGSLLARGAPSVGAAMHASPDTTGSAGSAGNTGSAGSAGSASSGRPGSASLRPDRRLTLLLLALVASGLAGLVQGFLDAGGIGSGWFQGYSDPMNSLRVGKSLWFGLMTVALSRDAIRRDPASAAARLAAGMLLGLVVVACAVLWERLAYPGLFDFERVYRATGLFWEMHVGGGAIDAYLALAMPFAWWAVAHARTRWLRLAALVLATVLVYACIVTFSRNVYLAVALPALVLAIAAWLRPTGHGLANAPQTRPLEVAHAGGSSSMSRRAPGSQLSLLAWLALAAAAVALPNWGAGSFLLNRLENTGHVLEARLAHWQRALGLLQTDTQWIAGIGLGRFAAHYAAVAPQAQFPVRIDWQDHPGAKSGQARAGSAHQGPFAPQSAVEASLGAARRSAHDPAFVELQAARGTGVPPASYALTQRVPIIPGARYQVELALRASTPTIVAAEVCERHLLYDWECQYTVWRAPVAQAGWAQQVRLLQGGVFRAQPWYAPRLGMFTLAVLNAGGAVAITDVHLTATGPSDLIENGDFDQQLAHWFPAAQYHFLPWHVDSLYLETLIERGWVGLLLLGALLALALQRLWRCGELPLGLPRFLAASLFGLVLVGVFGSVMDAPRAAFLFYLLALFACQLPAGRAKMPINLPPPPTPPPDRQ